MVKYGSLQELKGHIYNQEQPAGGEWGVETNGNPHPTPHAKQGGRMLQDVATFRRLTSVLGVLVKFKQHTPEQHTKIATAQMKLSLHRFHNSI